MCCIFLSFLLFSVFLSALLNNTNREKTFSKTSLFSLMLDFLHRVQQQDNNFIWEKMTKNIELSKSARHNMTQLFTI